MLIKPYTYILVIRTIVKYMPLQKKLGERKEVFLPYSFLRGWNLVVFTTMENSYQCGDGR